MAVLPVSVFPAGTVCVYHCEGSENPPAAANRRGQMMSPVVISYFIIGLYLVTLVNAVANIKYQ